MRWYLKINIQEIDAQEAMKTLEDIESKGWQDYLMLPGETGFNLLRGLEEHLRDPDHINGTYQIRNSHGNRPSRPNILISGTKAVFGGLMIVWSKSAEISNFYYREEKELDYAEKFGLKNPILIKCP